VALAYSLPADEEAAPYADAPEAEAWEAALLAAFVSWERCLRAIAMSSLRLVPWGTRIPFASAHSLISIYCQRYTKKMAYGATDVNPTKNRAEHR
jgi:hypothetical protein